MLANSVSPPLSAVACAVITEAFDGISSIDPSRCHRESTLEVLGKIVLGVEADHGDLGNQVVRHGHHLSEPPAERDLRGVVHVQVPEEQDAIGVERLEACHRNVIVVEEPVTVDVDHFRSDRVAQLLGLDHVDHRRSRPHCGRTTVGCPATPVFYEVLDTKCSRASCPLPRRSKHGPGLPAPVSTPRGADKTGPVDPPPAWTDVEASIQ